MPVTKLRVFLWCLRRVPAVLFFGVRFKSLNDGVCTVVMKANWRNRNPYGDAYFAAVLAAAEMATGIMLFNAIQHRSPKLSAIIQGIEAGFYRPVRGDVEFICTDGLKIEEAVYAPLGRKNEVLCNVTALNAKNKLVANVHINWLLRSVK